MPTEDTRLIRLHLEPGPDGVTLSITEAASADSMPFPVMESTVISEPTVIEVEA